MMMVDMMKRKSGELLLRLMRSMDGVYYGVNQREGICLYDNDNSSFVLLLFFENIIPV